MTDINDIKIVGMDENRPPMTRKESYIDLFFKLSLKAPADWCEDFNTLGRRIQPPVKVDPKKGVIMETYVHDMNLIQGQLDKIKDKIKLCNENYLEKQRQKQKAQAARQADQLGTNSKQKQLNEIVAGLSY